MNELFGLSMTWIAVGCVIATALIFVLVALIAVRNPVMFKMGLRNIPRRKAQTALIIIGLMLSTLIMSAAFGTGDTLTTSVTAEVYDLAGEADELILWDTDKQPAAQADQVIPLADVEAWQRQFANDPDIEAFVPLNFESLPVQNQRTRLNEASATIVGFRPQDAAALGGLNDIDGKPISLGPNEIAVNKELAEKIDAKPGDQVSIFYEGKPVTLVVKVIAPNEVLSGAFNSFAKQGGGVDFATLAAITGKGDNANGVFVSNTGGVKSGLSRSDVVVDKIEQAFGDRPYQVQPFKKDAVRFAELLGNAFTTIFVVFGLFSIAAGVLLIFLIFVMLAAERKPEMGMARAVGAKRRQLVESFLAEGMGYDLGAAVVGLIAGMGVTVLMVAIIKSTAGENLGLDLTVSFTPRSLIVAFCLGVIATFIVIFISSWRASRLNITAAIRDLPETHPYNPEAATWRGYVRAALNGVMATGVPVGLSLFLIGPLGMLFGSVLILIGLVAPWFYLLRGHNVGLTRDHRTSEGAPRWPWILGILLPGIGWFLILPWYFLALLLVVIVRDRKPASMPRWLPIAGIVVPPLGFVVALLQEARVQIAWSVGVAFAFGLAGAAMTYAGLERDSSFWFFLGVSLIFLFAAVTLRYFGVAPRLSFTVTSALLLVLWYLPGSVYEKVVGELNGDIEMFFLSGMVMVTASVFIVVYNADIVLPLIARLGSRFGRILPAIKTGVAYPLTARFRTGMTMVMIGLIMFSLVMMATMNTNFSAIFLNDESRGGFDIIVQPNENNRIDDLGAALQAAGLPPTDIATTAELRIAGSFEAEVQNRDGKKADNEQTADPNDKYVPEYMRFTVIGADAGFIQSTNIGMRIRAVGYETDEAVWNAIRDDPAKAVIPAYLIAPADPFGPPAGELLKLNEITGPFQPFTLKLRDPGTGNVSTITVIGIMKDAAGTFLTLGGSGDGTGGIITGLSTVEETFPASRGQRFYLTLKPGIDGEEYAKKVESALVQASADSLQKLLDDQQAISNGFLLVFQGFMGLGLIVGIAALAVVASRAVVERRQQIGMLRAIGYQRSMVALSFLFESGFIALSGILLGLFLGLSLSWVLFITGDFGEESKGAPFIVPWLNLSVICIIAFTASMLMTFLPARGASRVPVAEALRYE